MPFDGLPEGKVCDIAKLRVALAGVRKGWASYRLGGPEARRHCAIGWLLEATDWDRDATVRLALRYVYPALPVTARGADRLQSIWSYNDGGGRKRVVQLFEDAVRLAERAVA